MNITLTIPGFTPHGGIRVIMEWANWLHSAGHRVDLLCRHSKRVPTWFNLDPGVKIRRSEACLRDSEVLIVCSPHDGLLLESSLAPKRKFIFLQMLEHLFSPGNIRWVEKCRFLYGHWVPMFSISGWNIEHIRTSWPFRGPVYHIGNGVNLKDFPVEKPRNRDGKTVLVEGWNALNASKDTERIAPRAAQMLKSRGYRILAYSQKPLIDFEYVPDEFYQLPNLERLNDLYRRADILLKATHFDARSCSPMEAMTKGCVPVRAINEGDDDLVNGENCIRIPYNLDALYDAAIMALTSPVTRMQLGNAGRAYVQKYTWDHWMTKVEGVLTNGR